MVQEPDVHSGWEAAGGEEGEPFKMKTVLLCKS